MLEFPQKKKFRFRLLRFTKHLAFWRKEDLYLSLVWNFRSTRTEQILKASGKKNKVTYQKVCIRLALPVSAAQGGPVVSTCWGKIVFILDLVPSQTIQMWRQNKDIFRCARFRKFSSTSPFLGSYKGIINLRKRKTWETENSGFNQEGDIPKIIAVQQSLENNQSQWEGKRGLSEEWKVQLRAKQRLRIMVRLTSPCPPRMGGRGRGPGKDC